MDESATGSVNSFRDEGVPPDVALKRAHSRTQPSPSRPSETSRVRGTVGVVAHYIFNFVSAGESERSALLERAAQSLRVAMLGIDNGERHRDALAPGDLVLVYLGAPALEFIGRAELASAAHDWTPTEENVCPGDSPGGVLLAHVEEWIRRYPCMRCCPKSTRQRRRPSSKRVLFRSPLMNTRPPSPSRPDAHR